MSRLYAAAALIIRRAVSPRQTPISTIVTGLRALIKRCRFARRGGPLRKRTALASCLGDVTANWSAVLNLLITRVALADVLCQPPNADWDELWTRELFVLSLLRGPIQSLQTRWRYP